MATKASLGAQEASARAIFQLFGGQRRTLSGDSSCRSMFCLREPLSSYFRPFGTLGSGGAVDGAEQVGSIGILSIGHLGCEFRAVPLATQGFVFFSLEVSL